MASGVSRKDESFREYALTGPPWKVLLAVCFPLALYQALHSIFNVMDTLMASHISADSVSAVAVLNQIRVMISAVGNGLAIGGSIKISEAYGKGDYNAVRRQVATLYTLAVAIGAAVVVLLVPFAKPFLLLLQTPPALVETGVGYFRVEILSLVVTFFNTVYIAIERSRGHSRKILILNLVVILTKLGLTAFFVYVMESGVIMIAVATLVGQFVLLGYALWSMPRDEGAFRFSPRNIDLHRRTVLPVLNLSYPVAAEKMLFSAGKVTVNSMAGVYGDLTAGALGISNNIGGLTTGWQSGMQDGAAALISQNRGAGKYRRTLKLYGWLVAANVAIGLIGLAVVSGTLPWLARVFAQSKNQFDPVFQEMIVSIHWWERLGYITLGLHAATLALLLGYGYTKLTLLLNVMRVFVFRVPVLWCLQHFTALGAEAVGVTMMVSNVSAGVCAVLVAIPVILKIRRKAVQAEAAQQQDKPPAKSPTGE